MHNDSKVNSVILQIWYIVGTKNSGIWWLDNKIILLSLLPFVLTYVPIRTHPLLHE